MSFFDTKLMGDLLQRMNDHSRVEKFLTGQTLNVTFSLLSFAVFGCVLFYYNLTIFGIFLSASLLYGGWIAFFLKQRKLLDYELFGKQADNNNKMRSHYNQSCIICEKSGIDEHETNIGIYIRKLMKSL